jgi:hypothetical protein
MTGKFKPCAETSLRLSLTQLFIHEALIREGYGLSVSLSRRRT